MPFAANELDAYRRGRPHQAATYLQQALRTVLAGPVAIYARGLDALGRVGEHLGNLPRDQLAGGEPAQG
jgi:hypothetical protein